MSTPELAWFKSSYSSGSDGDCVEMALCTNTIHIRDSKRPQGPRLALAPETWAEFVAQLELNPGASCAPRY
ncbi:DUF397 domain-containing protein [Streptomyces sp. NPDC020607]|uniref:DUF397 domain-containing protein n=1 Tax=Streptomyces sp. NPDC020607 TaxID=3365082 RepID=UPI003798CCB9